MTGKEHATVIGLMSGTSLDGVDLACCRFDHNGHWHYKLLASECVPYPVEWALRLAHAFHGSPVQLQQLDIELGEFYGLLINTFIKKNKIKPDLIASHGHTIFHRPHEGYTLQIGAGRQIARQTGIIVVNNFRQIDINKGGQGAPLVPIGDRLLFGNYTICLNLGGIANLSFEDKSERLAFDICPANQVLNRLAEETGKPFDKNGEIARSGAFNLELYEQLNVLDFYQLAGPKSLGREWVESVFMPVLDNSDITVADKLHTVCRHIAHQTALAVNDLETGNILVTGGGAFNAFLVECLQQATKHKVIIPEEELVNYKEAIVFALLGLLRLRGEVNCLASVTGATGNSSAGDIHHINEESDF